MKILFSLLMFFATAALAQDSWKVTLNGKQVLQTSVEDTLNIIKIKISDLKKKGTLVVDYKSAKLQAGWERYIAATDATGKELKNTTTANFKISDAELNLLFKKTTRIKIYTWSLPTDPRLRERIRIRRIHLCTLVLK